MEICDGEKPRKEDATLFRNQTSQLVARYRMTRRTQSSRCIPQRGFFALSSARNVRLGDDAGAERVYDFSRVAGELQLVEKMSDKADAGVGARLDAAVAAAVAAESPQGTNRTWPAILATTERCNTFDQLRIFYARFRLRDVRGLPASFPRYYLNRGLSDKNCQENWWIVNQSSCPYFRVKS